MDPAGSLVPHSFPDSRNIQLPKGFVLSECEPVGDVPKLSNYVRNTPSPEWWRSEEMYAVRNISFEQFSCLKIHKT
jgi:hypothetical protein